jgi:hypothetical protein
VLLFENSIVCLVVFVCCFLPHSDTPVLGCGFFDASFWCLLLDQFSLIGIRRALLGVGFLFGEFDSGSGRTLAACLTHASRTVRPFGVHEWRTGE